MLRRLACLSFGAVACGPETAGGDRLPREPELPVVELGALPQRPVTEDLTLVGTARQADGIAILAVEVEGRPASATAPGFATWSVTFSHADLLSWSDPDTGELEVCARGRALWGGWSAPGCADLVVGDAPAR